MKRIERDLKRKIYKVQYFMNVHLNRISFSLGMRDILEAGEFKYLDFFEVEEGGLKIKPTKDSGFPVYCDVARKKCDINRKGLIIHLRNYLNFSQLEYKMRIHPVPDQNGFYTVITRPLPIKGQEVKERKLI